VAASTDRHPGHQDSSVQRQDHRWTRTKSHSDKRGFPTRVNRITKISSLISDTIGYWIFPESTMDQDFFPEW
ncbi:integrase catalytic, partial [Lasius niger]